MKKLFFVILPTLAVIAVIVCYWDWVITNPELTVGFLTSLILFAALTAALLNLRQMRHNRTLSTAMRVRDAYDSSEVLEARAEVLSIINEQKNLLDVVHNLKKNSPREFVKLISIPTLFETIGWLAREHCCEPKAIDEMLDWETTYKVWEPYIREIQRKQEGEPLDDSPTAMYGNFIWLVNTLMK